MGEARWYAAYTKHQHEKKCADLLAQKGIESYLPLYHSLRQWRDRRKRLTLPLFPGYVFFRSTMNTRLEVLSTPGVFFIVESAGRACPIPEHEIESIRILTNSEAVIEPHAYLNPGDSVQVRCGPLTGVCGILTRIKNRYRVVICVELLRQGVSVEVDLADVEKMPRGWAGDFRERQIPNGKPGRDNVTLGPSSRCGGLVSLR